MIPTPTQDAPPQQTWRRSTINTHTEAGAMSNAADCNYEWTSRDRKLVYS